MLGNASKTAANGSARMEFSPNKNMKSKSKLFDRLAAELVANERQEDEFTINWLLDKLRADGIKADRKRVGEKLQSMVASGEISVRIGRENGRQCNFYREI
jgi:hypothetical protein